MSWNFSNDVPIYLQIMEHFKVQIASGKLEVGDKIPPVRELALEAGVNPNTMQKALSELERDDRDRYKGLLHHVALLPGVPEGSQHQSY